MKIDNEKDVVRKVRVVVVDDDSVLRDAVCMLLTQETALSVVGVACDGQEGVDLVREKVPDVVIMDVRMPGVDGVEATRMIKTEHPGVAVIGLSAFDSASTKNKMLEAGAVDFITKMDGAKKLVPAILKYSR